MQIPYLTPEELAARYAFLCRSTELQTTNSIQAIEVELGTLRKMLQVDLLDLSKIESPNDFVEIYQGLIKELDRFEDFCTYPVLTTKFVVAFGGAFSAGKSSLINALLGFKLLPVEVDPTTSLPTFIFQGKEDIYHALNVHKRPIALLEDEFSTLTHDESARFGSQIAGLLNAVYISRKGFKWENLAFSDTPGYTKPDEVHSNARNDAQLARNQLNAAQAIVWVIAAENGGVTDTDLKFLKTLNPAIPLLIVVTRADKKTVSDIKDIVQGISSRLSQQSIPVVDVIAVSNRQTKLYPLNAVLDHLAEWNKTTSAPTFERNFLALLMRYRKYLATEKQHANAQLSNINQILARQQISGLEIIQQAAKIKLNQIEDQLLPTVDKLAHEFLVTLKSAYGKAGQIPVQSIHAPAKPRTVWQIHKEWLRQHLGKPYKVPDPSSLLNNLQASSNVKEGHIHDNDGEMKGARTGHVRQRVVSQKNRIGTFLKILMSLTIVGAGVWWGFFHYKERRQTGENMVFSAQKEKVSIAQKMIKVTQTVPVPTKADSKEFFNDLMRLSTENSWSEIDEKIRNSTIRIYPISDPIVAKRSKQLGLELLAKGDISQAIFELQKAATANQGDADVANALGLAMLRSGNATEATAYLLDTLMLEPIRAAAWLNLSEAFALQDKFGAADGALRLAVHFARDQRKAHEHLKQLAAAPTLGKFATVINAALPQLFSIKPFAK